MMTRLLTVMFVVASSGCALTKTTKEIAYQPAVDQSVSAAVSSSHFAIGQFKDARGIEDPNVLFQKRNMYNNTMSGSYAATRPVVEYIKDGVAAYMTAAGVEVRGSSLKLNASLEEFAEELLMGFWKSKLKTKMTIRFALVDANGKQIWNDTIIGKALIEKGDFVSQALTLTTDDVAKQLFADSGFQAAIKQD